MKKVFARLAVSAVLITAMLSGCSTAKETADENYVVKINGETVSREEFNIYMYETQKSFESLGGEDIWETDFDGRSAETVAKDNTLSTITLVKFAEEKAASAGIELDEETIAEAEASAEEVYNGLTDSEKEDIGADLELYKEVMRENALYNEVYKYMVKDYVISDEEFDEYYESNKDTITEQYKAYTGVSDSGETVDEAQVKDFARYYYEENMKQQYFASEFEKWQSEADIEKNAQLWNTVTLIR